VGIELVAEIAHDSLPDEVVKVGLAYADHAGDDGHDEHDGDEDDQELEVVLADGVVEDELDHEGVDQPQHSGEDDGDQHQDNLPFVGAECLGDPAHGTGVGLAATPLLLFGVGRYAAPTHPAHAMIDHRFVCLLHMVVIIILYRTSRPDAPEDWVLRHSLRRAGSGSANSGIVAPDAKSCATTGYHSGQRVDSGVILSLREKHQHCMDVCGESEGEEVVLMAGSKGSSAALARREIDPVIATAAITSFLVATSATILTVSGGIYAFRRPIQAGRRIAAAGMWLAGVRSHQTLLDGKPVPYYEHGPREGIPLVLLHGLGDAPETWAGVMWALARMSPDQWVLAPDVPGLGFAPREGSITITTITKSVLHFLDALHIGQAVLVGNSVGGQIVLHLAAHHPERVARAIAINPTGLLRGRRIDFRPENREEAQRLIAQVLARAPNLPDFILKDVVRIAHSERIGKFLGSYDRARDELDAGGDESDLARLARGNVPVTLIFGAADRLLPAETQAWFCEALPQAETLVLDGGGHTPQIEVPGELAALLAERSIESRLVAAR